MKCSAGELSRLRSGANVITVRSLAPSKQEEARCFTDAGIVTDVARASQRNVAFLLLDLDDDILESGRQMD
jgi:hypothetical protein